MSLMATDTVELRLVEQVHDRDAARSVSREEVTPISSLVARQASVRHVSLAKPTERQCLSDQLFSITASHELFSYEYFCILHHYRAMITLASIELSDRPLIARKSSWKQIRMQNAE